MGETKAARNSGNYSTPKTSTTGDEKILTDFERGTFYAALCFCAMFAFMIGWMWFTW